MKAWLVLIQTREERTALLWFALSAVLALVAGFVWVKPAQAEQLIVHGGYFYILTVFALWLYYAVRVHLGRRGGGPAAPRIGTVMFLLGATGFAVWSDAFAHKVLFDEYVLQGTAWHMHLTKEIGAPLRAYDFAGTWTVVDTFLDKRPYFFTFLVSLLHDLTGYRLANVYVLNVGLTFAMLGVTYWLARTLTGRPPAFLAVAALATLPLFGQNTTGASMELLNLTMIAVLTMSAVIYFREPNADRVAFLGLGAVLLAQTRYESVLFVFPVAGVILAGWRRAGRVILPWPVVLVPLLLVPYVWHDRFVNSKPILWQLREGESARFAWHYLGNNLDGARSFFLSTSPVQPNSLWLVVVGGLGVLWALVRLARRAFARAGRPALPAAVPVLAVFAATVAANLGMLMFYYWARLDEPIATRFALPLCFVLALAGGWLAHWLDRRGVRATRLASLALAGWALVFGASAFAHRFYTTHNLVMHELQWELEQATTHKGPVLWVTAKATMPFLLERIPAVNTSIAAVRAPQIAWHMRQGTFHDVMVSQVVRPTSAAGDFVIDPDEVLPSSFHLETVAEKRFGARWIRISRLVEISSVKLSGEMTGAPRMAQR